MPPQKPYRRVYRTFDHVGFDPRNPEEFASPVTEADIAATLALIEKQKRRRTRKVA
jgi:hypothetical protein